MGSPKPKPKTDRIGKGRDDAPVLPVIALFEKHGVDGGERIPIPKVEALAKKLGAPDSFDWEKHDPDGDGHLNKKETRKALGEAVDDWRMMIRDNPKHLD